MQLLAAGDLRRWTGKENMKYMLNFCVFIFALFPLQAEATESIHGEWISVNRTKGGLGATKTYKQNNQMISTFGALVDFEFKLDKNQLILSIPNTPDITQNVIFSDTKLILTDKSGNKQELTRLDKKGSANIAGRWIGNHYTGAKQILHFTDKQNCYFSVPFA
jgi:hypothetical protein